MGSAKSVLLARRAIVSLVGLAACPASDATPSDATGGPASSSTTEQPPNSATGTDGATSASGSDATATTRLDTTTTSGGEADDGYLTGIVPPDAGGVWFECDPLGINECEPGLSCVPWDAMGVGHWSGALCARSPRDPAALGQACSIPNGPIDGQSGCEAGLVCAAAPDAIDGVCIPLCNAFDACDVGRCTECAHRTLGVCLDAVQCDGEPCVATGCI